MILADKIIYLRKQAGWSQEELAEEMNVSRQSVSKWEGAQSIPDMDKILMLSSIFGVSTDFLLKDDVEELEGVIVSESNPNVRKLSLEETTQILEISQDVAPKIALGVFLCILSPIALILLSDLQELKLLNLSEDLATAFGFTILIVFVIVAVGLFILNGSKAKEYQFLETDDFELQYGVKSIVKEKQAEHKEKNLMHLIFGIGLCIVAILPILYFGNSSQLISYGVPLTLFIVASGVFLIVRAAGRQGIYDKILKEGDYTPKNKKGEKLVEMIASIYWTIIVVIYLGYSFSTGAWESSWIIWPISGILFGGIAGAIYIFYDNH